MTYALNLTNKTMEEVYVNLGAVVPSFWPLVLLFEFIIILVIGAFANKRFTGVTNTLAWIFLSSMITTISAFILRLVDGLVNTYVLTVTVVLTLIFGIIYMLAENDKNSF